jgi:transcriptional regulator with XRE-family HTH domain
MSQLGSYIVRRREQKGWTRAELARVSGVPYSTLSSIELNKKNTKPQEGTLRAIATALDEDVSQLRVLAGYDVVFSSGVSERAKRIDALLTVAPRWGAAMLTLREMDQREQDEALTVLEVHLEMVKRRKRSSGRD